MPRALAAAIVFAIACGGSSMPGPVATVTVTPTTATIAVGATQSFAATLRDASGNRASGLVTWSSSDSTIAALSATGVATGVKTGGPVTITAAVGSITGSAELTVTAAAAQPVTIEWSLNAETTTVTTTVSAGATVQWHNVDTQHSVVPDTVPPPISAGPAAQGSTYGAQVFSTPGTYHYHCGIHPTMHGTITVQ